MNYNPNTPNEAKGLLLHKRYVLFGAAGAAAALVGWNLQRGAGDTPTAGLAVGAPNAQLKEGAQATPRPANLPRLNAEARSFWLTAYPVVLPAQTTTLNTTLNSPSRHSTVQISETAANLTQSQGHGAVLVNFWATWCPPCVAELPLLSAFSAQMQGVAVQKRIVTLGVAVDKMAAVDKFLTAKPLSFASLVVDGSGISFAKALGNTGGLPFSVLLSPDARVLYRHTGALEAADLQKIAKMV